MEAKPPCSAEIIFVLWLCSLQPVRDKLDEWCLWRCIAAPPAVISAVLACFHMLRGCLGNKEPGGCSGTRQKSSPCKIRQALRRDICGTAPRASAFFSRFILRERCGHMCGLSARPSAAGLDEVRDTRG